MRSREELDDAERGRLTSFVGSFLGEAVVQSFGGRWACVGSGVGVWLGPGSAAFPFDKVAKLFDGGEGDSIVSFYKTIPIIFAETIERDRSGSFEH